MPRLEHFEHARLDFQAEARAVEDSLVMGVRREIFGRVLAEFPEAASRIRAALAKRTLKLVNGLEAVRVKSLDGAAAPGGRAPR